MRIPPRIHNICALLTTDFLWLETNQSAVIKPFQKHENVHVAKKR